MRNAGLEEAQAGIKIARRNINNLRYADDTTLTAESESESEIEVAQSCLAFYNLMDCSLPGSCIHGILQARVLEWVAIAFSIIQCNSYQTTNGIFHRTRTNSFIICMETHKKRNLK